jgi:3-hydroxyacyl-[acyl-carrier-protein] dehydratase
VSGTAGLVDTAGLVARIPHRYPMLLVDRVVAVEPGEWLVAVKAVTASEPCYARAAGAAPLHTYRYPAPLLLESLAQTAVVLAAWTSPNPDVRSGKLPLAASVRGVRFLRAVHPGDLIEHRVQRRTTVGDMLFISAVSTVDGEPVLEVDQFVLTMRDMADLIPADAVAV